MNASPPTVRSKHVEADGAQTTPTACISLTYAAYSTETRLGRGEKAICSIDALFGV